jgi:hypothetical protein
MTEPIDIPPICYVVKPYFKNRPSQEKIDEIKDWIRKTGRPLSR